MKCSRIERLLNMYIDKELPKERTVILEQHLAGCQKCIDKLNELTKLKILVRDTKEYTPNPFLWTRIKASLTKEPSGPAWILSPKTVKIWVAVTCTLILLFSIVLSQLTTAENSLYEEESSIQEAIRDVTPTPFNVEEVSLNLLIYNGKNMEVNYVLF